MSIENGIVKWTAPVLMILIVIHLLSFIIYRSSYLILQFKISATVEKLSHEAQVPAHAGYCKRSSPILSFQLLLEDGRQTADHILPVDGLSVLHQFLHKICTKDSFNSHREVKWGREALIDEMKAKPTEENSPEYHTFH